jgi:hypothetical protein
MRTPVWVCPPCVDVVAEFWAKANVANVEAKAACRIARCIRTSWLPPDLAGDVCFFDPQDVEV